MMIIWSPTVFKALVFICIYYANVLTVEAQSGFIAEPVSVTQAPGLGAVFQCAHKDTNISGYTWIFNNDFINPQSPPNGVSIGEGSLSLTVTATQQYNNSAVQCRVTIEPGNGLDPRFERSEIARLQVQDFGPLTLSLPNYTSVVISWYHIYPLSVDYYVDVRGSGGATVESHLVDSNSSIVEFPFTSPVICDKYTFTVTPTNGTHNSTFMQQDGQYLLFQQSDVDITCLDQESDVQCNVVFESPLADGVCNVELVFKVSDGEALSDNRQAVSINLEENGDKVYRVDGLLQNRFYSVNTSIMMDGQRTVISTQIITTHDILIATASGSENGSLTTSPTYVNNTKATGCLIIVSNQTCSEETIYLALYDTSGTPDTLEGVGEGNHRVTFFDIESNGMPMISRGDGFTGAADVEDVSIQTGGRTSESAFKSSFPSHQFMDQGKNEVCVNCSRECLVLLYNCENPRAIVSLKISKTGRQCIPVQLPAHAGYYIGALFDFSNSRLARYPDDIRNFTFDLDGSSSTTTVATSSIIICFLVSASAILLLI